MKGGTYICTYISWHIKIMRRQREWIFKGRKKEDTMSRGHVSARRKGRIPPVSYWSVARISTASSIAWLRIFIQPSGIGLIFYTSVRSSLLERAFSPTFGFCLYFSFRHSLSLRVIVTHFFFRSRLLWVTLCGEFYICFFFVQSTGKRDKK